MEHPYLFFVKIFEAIGLGHFAHTYTHVVYSWVLMAILIIAGALATKTISMIPGKAQNLFEVIVSGIEEFMVETAGEEARWLFPLAATIFLYIFIGNLIGIVPGFFPPTANLNTTASCAIVVVVFTHIPFVSGAESRTGYQKAGAAPSVIEIDGQSHFRHTVYNHQDVLGPIQDRLDVALEGHIHIREVLKYQTQGGEQRLITAAAVVGPPPGDGADYGPVSGITLHRVTAGHVDDGTFLPLDVAPGGR